MDRVVLNSNVPAMGILRRLDRSSRDLAASFERLSSGLRINRASDDPAGLAIASSLNVDSRVYGQAVRNVSDGISMLNIAESTGIELTSLLTRMRELATQSANGTLSVTQRRALDQEARALTGEYNRILSSTKFNDLNLLGGSLDVGIQLGYGSENALSIALGESLERAVGDGTYTSSASTVNSGYISISGDLNNDGIDDLVTSDAFGGSAFINLSNGDGSFNQVQVIGPPVFFVGATLGDFNEDGFLDLVLKDLTSNATVYTNDGDGTFTGTGSIAFLQSTLAYASGDYNGDGHLDVASAGSNTLSIALGNGDGTFQTTQLIGGAGTYDGLLSNADINGDGILDLIAGPSAGTGTVSAFIGNGDGTFTDYAITRGGSLGGGIAVLDANHDGFDDFVASSTNNGLELYLSNGDGSFTASTLGSSDGGLIQTGDLNSDGLLDIVDYGTTAVYYLANADGSFQSAVDIGAAGAAYGAIADFDNDGGVDVFVAQIGNGTLYTANTEQVTSLQYVDLLSQEKALASFSVIDLAMDNLLVELGNLGAFTSRLATASSSLALSRDNVIEAASRIMDADIASEAAELSRTQILQQAGAAILAQANTLPSLALRLLSI